MDGVKNIATDGAKIILDQLTTLNEFEFINNFSQNIIFLVTFILTSAIIRLIIILAHS